MTSLSRSLVGQGMASADRVQALLRHDLRLQWRYRIHAAYFFVTTMYILVLTVAERIAPGWLYGFIIYSDPAVLGFFFLGGLVMFERNEGVSTAFAAAPVSAGEYLISKVITLTAISLVVAWVLALLHGGRVNWLLLSAAIALTSVFFIGIGAYFATRFRTVTGYLLGGSVVMMPLVTPPLLAFLDRLSVISFIVPTIAQMRLVLVAFAERDASAFDITFMLISVTGWAVASFVFGARALTRSFGHMGSA